MQVGEHHVMDLTRTLESSHALHAASVHLPISQGLVGLPLLLIAVFASKQWPRARSLASIYFFLTALVSAMAAFTGERAASELVALASKTIESVVYQHQILGFSIAALALSTSILLAASQFTKPLARSVFSGLALTTAAALAVVVLFAGSSGGRLVYGFGIGTPVANADGTSGATLIVGANPMGKSPNAPPTATTRTMEESEDAKYTPHTKPIDTAQAAAVSFMKDVVPVLERHCFKCHEGTKAKAGLDLTTHAGIMKGGDYAGACVVPGEADQSAIVMHIRGIYEPKMPKNAPELTEDELHTIRMWIASGAKGE